MTSANGSGSRPAPPVAAPRGISSHGLNRHRLPDERPGIVHKFAVGGHEGYIQVGMYPDGKPGEVFVKMAKQGSTVSGLMDGIALMTSICLQYGVPLGVLVDKMSSTRFEPSGVSSNPAIGHASSVLDYIFRYLELKFLDGVPANGDEYENGMPHADHLASNVEDAAQEAG